MKTMNKGWAAASTLAISIAISLACAACGKSPDSSQPDSANAHSVAVKTITTPEGIEMAIVPSGEFVMGAKDGKPDERPATTIRITAPFAMDVHEVTQQSYETLMLANPSHFKAPQRPIEQVRWSDAAEYCNARSETEGLEPCYDEDTYACNFAATGYRLPTEAEWEYAARAGAKSKFDFGNSKRKLNRYAWYAGNSGKQTQRVGKRQPNRWGLYDMYGNVMEWVHDVYDENYYGSSDRPRENPRGPRDGRDRVLRGGAWNSNAEDCRVTIRMHDNPGTTDACFAQDTYGFRCVRRLSSAEMEKPAAE